MPPEPGRTRTCPHCKSTILESADVCPACHHHLRFGADRAQTTRAAAEALFRVEGTVRASAAAGPVEYSVVVALYDDAGAEIAREVVNVGALWPGQGRKCVVSIDAQPVTAAVPAPSRPTVVAKAPGFVKRG